MEKRSLSFKKSLVTIALVTLLVSGGAGLSVLYVKHISESQRADPAFYIQTLDQNGRLPSHYIEELLGLCVDLPQNIHEFSVAEAKVKLLDSPLIRAAEVKKQLPDSCSVSYSLYEPFALLDDWENAAIDSDGRLIPYHPFFFSEGLPHLVIGEVEKPEWGKKLRLSRVRLAVKILKSLPYQELRRLDVSRVDLPGFGRREIVLTLDDGLLRLNPDQWITGWKRYLAMRHLLKEKELPVVDLRIPRIALIGSAKDVD